METQEQAEQAAASPLTTQTFRYAGDNGELEQTYPTEDHKVAWQEYYAHPAVQVARATCVARMEQLRPITDTLMALDEFYRREETNARLAFQQGVHEPLLELTQKLMALDQVHTDAVAATVQQADVVAPAEATAPDGEPLW